MTLLHHILLNSFICYGVFYATRYDPRIVVTTNVDTGEVTKSVTRKEILGFIKKYGDQFLPEWMRKPLYDCPMCMGSVWSVVSATYFGLEVITDIVPMILATCGVNFIIHKLSPYND